MTPEERFERIETLLNYVAEQQQQTAVQQQQITEQQRVNSIAIAATNEQYTRWRQDFEATTAEFVQWFTEVLTRIDGIQAEVRGLQTENRRILERLEQHCRDGHGA